jgi:23S rRNA (uracil1939-C5)-methyltransferase
MSDPDLPEVRFSALVYGGLTLGRLEDGRAAFAPYALPGERARVRVTENRKGYVRGELGELLEASPLRIPPRCRHFTACGGCHYQHLPASAQLEAKSVVVREQLARLAGLPDPPLLAPVPSPTPWNYRNRLRFHRAPDGRLGFRAFRSARVVPLEECHLPEPELAALWLTLPRVPGAPGAVLRRGTAGSPQVLPADPQPGEEPSAGASVEFALPGGRFRVSGGSFFQVNTPLAGRLAETVTRVLTERLPHEGRGSTVADLYCGVGLFSLYAAPWAGRVIGVELAPDACADFSWNLRAHSNAELVRGPVEERLPHLEVRPQAVIADPPRAGLGPRVIRALAGLGPRLLVYVSCDPATLARDARELCRQGFGLESVTPFDLFPQTYHIETLSVWSRPNGSAIIAS